MSEHSTDSTNEYVDLKQRVTPIESIPGYHLTDRGPEVFGPIDGPIDAPVRVIEQGPLYIDADESMPELASREEEFSASLLSSSVDKTGYSKAPFDRRDFFKLFTAAAATGSAACVRRPLEKAVPYVNQPVDQAVGIPTYFASTCGECAAGCGVSVKTSSGVPIKIEGLAEHPLSQGSTCATGQATLQSLFHPERTGKPYFVNVDGTRNETSWDDMLEMVASRWNGKKIAIFKGGSTGNQNTFFGDVLKKWGQSDDDLYTYESNSLYESISQAHKIVFGAEGIPRVDLRFLKTIVGLGADFLDIGISPVFFAKSFSQFHDLNKDQKAKPFGKFIQFESMMTQTGAKSDERFVIPPSSEIVTALLLMKAITDRGAAGGAKEQSMRILAEQSNLVASGYELLGVKKEEFDRIAEELLRGGGAVLAGNTAFDQNSLMLQVATCLINEMIGAYGKALFIDRAWMNSPVRAGDLARFKANASRYEVVFFIGTNPAFTLPESYGFAEVVKKIPTVVSMQPSPNETDRLANVVMPINHYLESWGDVEPVAGFISARQPVVRPVKGTRQAEEIFMWMLAHQQKSMGYEDYRAYLIEKWAPFKQFNAQTRLMTNDVFFSVVLRRGFGGQVGTRIIQGVKDVASLFKVHEVATRKGLRLIAPLDPRLHDGRGADKPILQEIGDGMTTIAWDTWVAMNPDTAKKNGFRRNDVLKIETPQGSIEVALYPLPGVHPDAVVIHRGNGHDKESGVVQGGIGVNPLKLCEVSDVQDSTLLLTSGVAVTITSTGKLYRLAAMQKAHDIGNRTGIVKKYSVEEASARVRTKSLDDVPDLYPALKEDAKSPYRWGMSVDLTKCTGCGACMAACSVENNVPQIGRDDILLGREMHWIRLDRYFAGDLNNPQVTFQPMMCQQCTHAPCEAVCPVIATSHDPEGLNVMTYNRCIGTRYCANACPYKVRRFNWWTHKWGVMGDRKQDRMPRAMNPEVTVRTRGVMEKCTFCIQRLRQAKYVAIEQGRTVRDGEVLTACAQVCPSDAITFGNIKDTTSRVARERNDPRSYLALGGDPDIQEYGLKTLPNVSYMAVVAHRAPLGTGLDGEHHGSPAAAGHGNSSHDSSGSVQGEHK
jgi:Fe-S-cluster-containing dehydrogenase component/anaerobic selenocysteine-containing dehydrogenase